MKRLVLNEHQQELAEKNHDLIYWFAKSRKLDLEEYYGELAIELCKAAYHYAEGTGYSFSTFAVKCMDNRLKRLYQIKKRTFEDNEEVLSLDYVYYADDDTPYTLGDIVQDDTKNVEQSTLDKIESESISNSLNEREKYIINSLFIGKTQRQIADEIGVSYQRVHQIVKKIRKSTK